MAQSMLDFVNQEFRSNQDKFKKQVEPLTNFFTQGYEASLKIGRASCRERV